jgi:hypothetical protein
VHSWTTVVPSSLCIQPTGDPGSSHVADVISAIASIVVAVAGVAGLIAANNRVRRATVKVAGSAFAGPRGPILRVAFVVKSVGLGKLKLPPSASDRSLLKLYEILDTGTVQRRIPLKLSHVDSHPFQGKEVIGSQEDAGGATHIILPAPSPDALGWQLAFDLQVRKRWPLRGILYWSATDFVPIASLNSPPRDPVV